MSQLKIALVQFYSEKGRVEENFRRIARIYGGAVRAGMEIVAFPEMSLTGYIHLGSDPAAVLRLDGPEVARITTLTRGQPAALLVGLVEANPGGLPFITQIVAQDGRLSGYYRKRTIEGEEAAWYAPGEGTPVFHWKGIPYGLAICADVGNPTVFADCARGGARVVFELAAPGLYGDPATRDWVTGFSWWRGECRTRLSGYAREHGLWIGVATQAGRTRDEDFPGGGYIFAPDGRCVGETPHWAPGVLYAGLDLDRNQARIWDPEAGMARILFLCTGNYYRSRFAEALFNTLAEAEGLSWRADSRGLAVERGTANVGPIAPCVVEALSGYGCFDGNPPRWPLPATAADFAAAEWVIALDELEHRPLILERFPRQAEAVEYWSVSDLDRLGIAAAFEQLTFQVRQLIAGLAGRVAIPKG